MTDLTPEVLAIHQWIRDDAPVSMKMTITPKLIDALVQRLDAARSEGDVSSVEGAGEWISGMEGLPDQPKDLCGSRDEPTVGATAALAIQPTQEQIDAGVDAWHANTGLLDDVVAAVYRAMAAAAPPPDLPDEVVRLVKAASEVLYNACQGSVDLDDNRELDEALAPFADRLPTEEGA